MSKLKILYACSEVPARSFFCIVSSDSTCEDVLKTISKLQSANYIALFFDGKQISGEEDIINYCRADKILYASTTVAPPTVEFMNNVKLLPEPKSDITANLYDPDRVEQIIFVNFDESESMNGEISIGTTYNDNEPSSEKVHRVTIGIQYLTSFINNIYNFHIQSIQGLVSFNDQIDVKCPLSPHASDFEEKGLIDIHPRSTARMWDSLLRSCNEIVKFRKDNEGNDIYNYAQSRILVISSGEEDNSNTNVGKVVKELIKNKITVDSVIINNSEDEGKMLCAACHATGGLAFRPETVSKGLSLFKQSAFLNINERRKIFIHPLIPGDRKTHYSYLAKNCEIITAEFMFQAKENAFFDSEIQNKIILSASTSNISLATPHFVCAVNANTRIPSANRRRIFRELHVAEKTNDPSNESFFDPDMKIYTFRTNLDQWKVFLKGQEGTPYENKWWYLYVTFPKLYPVQPPIFRFISVPYHFNVFSDGRICLNAIDRDYNSSKHVVDLIQEIKKIFLIPDIDTPIHIEAYNMFKNNPTQYSKLAKESSENNAKDKFEDFIDSARITSEVEEKKEKEIPKNMVLASTGVYYDRDELRMLLASRERPICVITGEVLTERLEDLDDTDDN